MNNTRKGFTLLEIMIVVVIIGLLAALSIPALQSVRETSVRSTVLAAGKQIASAAQQEMGTDVREIDFTIDAGIVTIGDATLPINDQITGGGTVGNDNQFTLAHPSLPDPGTITFDSNGVEVPAED